MTENNSNFAELGISEVDITPKKSVQTVGFGRSDEWSRGILNPLSAQISIWSFNHKKCCLIAIDHIGFAVSHANQLRSEVAEMLSIHIGNVMLCFSHTHSAPNESIENEYFCFLRSQVKSGILKAMENMSSIHAAWGNAYAEIGINRRSEFNETDKRIGILKVTDASSGSLKLILLRLTAHANVLKEDNYLISPDYFGTARDLLKQKYGCTIMLTQGASGNVAPKYYHSSITPPDISDTGQFCNSATALNDMADEIYRNTDYILKRMIPGNITNLKMYSVCKDLYADVPSIDKAMKIASDAKKYAGIDGSLWMDEVHRLHAQGIKNQKETVEIQYFTVNSGGLCGVPNEIMCEFAIEAEKLLKNSTFYLGGYTNGCTGYFPTESEYDKGGYEVYWSMLIYYQYHGRVSPLNRNSASEFIAAVAENYQKQNPFFHGSHL